MHTLNLLYWHRFKISAAETAAIYIKSAVKPFSFSREGPLAANETVSLRCYLASLLARRELRDH